jgi:hypothetical protein
MRAGNFWRDIPADDGSIVGLRVQARLQRPYNPRTGTT